MSRETDARNYQKLRDLLPSMTIEELQENENALRIVAKRFQIVNSDTIDAILLVHELAVRLGVNPATLKLQPPKGKRSHNTETDESILLGVSKKELEENKAVMEQTLQSIQHLPPKEQRVQFEQILQQQRQSQQNPQWQIRTAVSATSMPELEQPVVKKADSVAPDVELEEAPVGLFEKKKKLKPKRQQVSIQSPILDPKNLPSYAQVKMVMTLHSPQRAQALAAIEAQHALFESQLPALLDLIRKKKPLQGAEFMKHLEVMYTEIQKFKQLKADLLKDTSMQKKFLNLSDPVKSCLQKLYSIYFHRTKLNDLSILQAIGKPPDNITTLFQDHQRQLKQNIDQFLQFCAPAVPL